MNLFFLSNNPWRAGARNRGVCRRWELSDPVVFEALRHQVGDQETP